MLTANRDVAVFTPDLASAETFYDELFGAAPSERSDGHLRYDSGPLCLYVVKAAEPRGWTPSFDTPDAARTRERLLALGCEALTDGDGGGHFRDPFGFVFDVLERRS